MGYAARPRNATPRGRRCCRAQPRGACTPRSVPPSRSGYDPIPTGWRFGICVRRRGLCVSGESDLSHTCRRTISTPPRACLQLTPLPPHRGVPRSCCGGSAVPCTAYVRRFCCACCICPKLGHPQNGQLIGLAALPQADAQLGLRRCARAHVRDLKLADPCSMRSQA